jgi:uncharacterized protein
MPSFDIWTIATIAFVGSFGHCVGMCGGFVVAYSSAKVDTAFSKSKQILSHLFYNAGRVGAYTVIGAFCGLLGTVFVVNTTMHGILYLVVGALMILMGLAMFGIGKILHSIEYSMGKLPLFQKIFVKLVKSKSARSFFLLGLLNGFFPCGFVYFFATKAIVTASVVDGAMVMCVFGLATMPVMMALGQSVSALRALNFRQAMNQIAAMAILIYGIFTIYIGLAYFFDLPL